MSRPQYHSLKCLVPRMPGTEKSPPLPKMGDNKTDYLFKNYQPDQPLTFYC